jgi:hypothetical protein
VQAQFRSRRSTGPSARVATYNALNANSVRAVTSSYGAAWLRPQQILDPRLLQIGGHISFRPLFGLSLRSATLRGSRQSGST